MSATAADASFCGDGESYQVGFGMAAGEDITGDGILDLLFATYVGGEQPNAGAVHVYPGTAP